MKILVYCQHVLGIGHLARALHLVRALEAHEVVLVTGGPRTQLAAPPHVRVIQLPPLAMDETFGVLYPPEDQRPVEAIRSERLDRLLELFRTEAPELFIVELYPFGRKAFRHELDPLLAALHEGSLPPARTICSVRDILVEKPDRDKHESRAVRVLNHFFSAVLVHSDPSVVRLEESFSRSAEIEIPVLYTGYVAPPGKTSHERPRRGSPAGPARIVVSAGGGKVGHGLCKAVIECLPRLQRHAEIECLVLTGPFMDETDFRRLTEISPASVRIRRFMADLAGEMARADLSISMAGYNTCMDILAAEVPALVLPFQQNREQRLRAERLAERGAMRVLGMEDLRPERLAGVIQETLASDLPRDHGIRTDGAERFARWVEQGFPETQENMER